MLHTYFAIEHGGSPSEERDYLLHAAESGVSAILIHATPVAPTNEELFGELDRRLRLIHVGAHGVDLPEQAFFAPDYRLAGMMAVARLLACGCRRLRLVSGLKPDHHVSQLIDAGVALGAGAGYRPAIAPLHPGSGFPAGAEAALAGATQDDGLISYADGASMVVGECLAARGEPPSRLPRHVCITESAEDKIWPGIEVLAFSWLKRVEDAVEFVLRAHGPCHRLYAPEWRRREQEK